MIPTSLNPMGTIGGNGLPIGWTELEYLESTGTQYIDTGVLPWSDMLFYIDAEAPGADANLNYALNGSTWNNNPGIPGEYRVYPWHVYNNGATVMVWGQNNVKYIDESKLKYTGRLSITVDGAKAVINGDIIPFRVTSPASQCGDSIYIFNRHNPLSPPASAGYAQRIFEVKLDNHRGGKVHMMPALDPTGRPCMFDLVTRRPFYNQGTGEFLWRAKVPSGYTVLEYIESVGARQYIDTGVVPNADYTIEADAMFINPVALSTVYWCRETSAPGISYPSFGLLSANAPSGNMRLRVYHGVNGSSSSGIYDVNLQAGQRFKFEAKAVEFYVNGTKTTMTPPSSYTPVTTIGLFWLHEDGSWMQGSEPATTSSVRMYSFMVKSADKRLKQLLVPTKDASNRPCMFDLVTRRPFYNQGTGEFLYA